MSLFSLISGFGGAETFWTSSMCCHLWLPSYFMHFLKKKRVSRGWECKREKIDRIICSSENKIYNLYQASWSAWLRSDYWYRRNSRGFPDSWVVSDSQGNLRAHSLRSCSLPHPGSWGLFIVVTHLKAMCSITFIYKRHVDHHTWLHVSWWNLNSIWVWYCAVVMQVEAMGELGDGHTRLLSTFLSTSCGI